jgi:hypothetical protein
MDFQKLFVCPRCDNYVNPLASMGRWQCFFHPGEYIAEKGYTCCGQRVRPLRYNPNYVLLGAHEEYVKPPRGCTPCDCGEDLSPIHIDNIKNILDQIDIDKWQGFDFPYLYRSEDTYINH